MKVIETRNMKTPTMPKYHRQRFLLALLETLGGRVSKISRIDFQKLLFLSQQEMDCPHYDFVPYRYGCYSFQAQADIERLESFGWLEEKPKSIRLLAKPKTCLSDDKLNAISKLAKKFRNYRGQKLIRYVYRHYPYYAARSEIAQKVLNHEALKQINKEKGKRISKTKIIYTIGYEGLSFESYINLLLKNDVRILCDVRRNPISRKFGFSKGMLSRLLPKFDIQYLHVPDLGIRSDMRQGLDSTDDYANLFKVYRKKLPGKAESLRLLLEQLKIHKRIALTCYEREPCMCHRHCISDYLKDRNKIRTRHLRLSI